MKNERAGSPASVRFKFTWSTSIDECNGSDEICPMKDPRSKWEETVPDGELQIYYNMGMIQYVFPITIFGSIAKDITNFGFFALLIAIFRM